jgi:hypothetical protein
MSGENWTPGPWWLEQPVEDGVGASVGVSGHGHRLLAKAVWRAELETRTLHAEANANLIAAAPELYEALEGMLTGYQQVCSVYGLYCENSQFWQRGIEALAKARGDQ